MRQFGWGNYLTQIWQKLYMHLCSCIKWKKVSLFLSIRIYNRKLIFLCLPSVIFCYFFLFPKRNYSHKTKLHFWTQGGVCNNGKWFFGKAENPFLYLILCINSQLNWQWRLWFFKNCFIFLLPLKKMQS